MNILTGDPSTKSNANTFDDSIKDEKFETDVEGVYADGYIARGTTKFPMFDVSQEEFNQNMIQNRQRIRFKQGSQVQAYMQQTRYKIPFYIRCKDSGSNKNYIRKIK